MKKSNLFLFFALFVIISFCFVNKSFAQVYNNEETGFIYNIGTQPDGKIIIIGDFTSYNGVERNGIARLNSDGSLDMSFNPGMGIKYGSISSSSFDYFRSVYIQPDGKIIIIGHFLSYNGVERNGIARLNSDGSLDMSFNPTGLTQKIGENATYKRFHSFIVQSDGKMILAGSYASFNFVDNKPIVITSEDDDPRKEYLIRLNSDGSLDTSFNFESEQYNPVIDLVVQLDGKIIINIEEDGLLRLNSDGSLDTSFNISLGEIEDVFAIELQQDGKIIATVFSLNESLDNNSSQIYNIRLNLDGSLDTNFNDATKEDYVFTPYIQPDGKIILSTSLVNIVDYPKNSIMRLNSDGSVDTSFNSGLKENSIVSSTSIQKNGKILVVLLPNEESSETNTSSLVRLNSDGSLDTSFDIESESDNPNDNIIIPNTLIELPMQSELDNAEDAPARLRGQLLLQVEDHGRIWYIDLNGKRYEVTFANALSLFQKLSLGISNKDLNNIPLSTEDKTSSTGNKLKGQLLLQVEDHGRIWYVDLNGKRWEVTWNNLMDLFTKLSLGITNADLSKISMGEVLVVDNIDTDSDGLTDTQESIYKTDPNNPDTDEDGYLDGEEVNNGYDPLKSGVDTDSDGLTDTQESIYKTDPNNPDTDEDGYLDGEEINNGYDPLKFINIK